MKALRELSAAAAIIIISSPLILALDYDKEGGKPAQEVSSGGDAQKLSADAEKLSAPGPDITYAQVMERPDDPALNYAYARAQVRRGDLKGAASTLERMLMVDPSLHNIRLFYAIVLYRLDNLVESGRELETLRGSGAPADVREEAGKYLKAIRRKQRTTILSGSLGTGFEYDYNRNASPASGKRLFAGAELPLTGDSRRQGDSAYIFTGNAGVKRGFGAGNRHEAFGSFSYYRADQKHVESVSLRAFSYRAGVKYRAGLTEITPRLFLDHVLLARKRFMDNTGAALRLDRKIGKRNGVFLEAGHAYHGNFPTPGVLSNPERKGGFDTLSAGAGRVLGPTMKLDAEAYFARKRAHRHYNSFDRAEFGLKHSWLLGSGMFLLSSAYIGRDGYRQADTAIGPRKRADDTFRGGALFGVPVSALHRRLARLDDLALTLNYEYFRSDSNITNYTYDNHKAVLMLTYKWEAGI